MIKVTLLNKKGEKIEDIKLNEEIFGITPNKNVLHDAIILSRASQRQGTHDTKNRSEVRGGGRKPWRQKGTGRARQGSIRAVQWRGGGIAFGPTPRSYSIKQNKKERRLALKSAVVAKLKDFVVVEDLKLTTPKTKDFISLLKGLKLENEKVLVIDKVLDENLILASRNLGNVLLLSSEEINVLDLIAANKILVTKDGLKEIEEVLN